MFPFLSFFQGRETAVELLISLDVEHTHNLSFIREVFLLLF